MIAACHHPRRDRGILTTVSSSQLSLRRPLLCDASVWGRLVHTLHFDTAERLTANGWTSSRTRGLLYSRMLATLMDPSSCACVGVATLGLVNLGRQPWPPNAPTFRLAPRLLHAAFKSSIIF